jgi:predicted DNA binding CopG/RHH family protein
MKREYDFSKAKKNPYYKKLKKQITLRLDIRAIDYFKHQAEEMGIPYQNLIDLYLTGIAKSERKPTLAWLK